MDILEYCDKKNVRTREQHYINILNPEYNILKFAGSSLGHKHSEETIAKIKAIGLTPEQKIKHLDHLKKHNSSEEQREKSRQRLLEYNKSKGFPVEVFDSLNNETTVYSSIREAAQAIQCAKSTIKVSLERSKKKGISDLIKKRFIVKLLNNN